MKEQISFLNGYLRFALTANIVFVISGMVLLFLISDAYGVYAVSICSASALFNCIGLTLLLRWHKCGALFVTLPSLLSTIAISVTCAGWLTYRFGSFGIYMPYFIFVVYTGTLFVLLYHKVRGNSPWQQMDNSLDLVHFRHIYQLSTVIIVAIAVTAYFVVPNQPEVNIGSEDEISHLIENVSPERLDAADVTIEEVVSFEKQYNEANDVNSRDKKVKKRIFALKHLLLSGLMPEIHNRENLVNICMVHAGDFSPEQQKILDWYLALDISIQDEWNVCEKATSIKEFKRKIEERMK